MSKEYAFCENAAGATPWVHWHIRPIGDKGLCPGGGADTDALCGREVSWDIDVEISDDQLEKGICTHCKALYGGTTMHGHRDEAIEFGKKCEAVVDNLGRDEETDREIRSPLLPGEDQRCRVYEDNHMKIVVARNNEAMAVVRKENRNPVLWVKSDGEIMRYHGQAKELSEHLQEVYNGI